MKQKLLHILALLLLTVCARQTALSQEADTSGTALTKKFDELLNEFANTVNYSEAVTQTVKKLQEWYAEANRRYDSSQANVISLLKERDAATLYIGSLKAALRDSEVRTAASEAKYQTVYNKRNRAIGVSLIPVSYDFIFRRVVLAQVGLSITPNWARFSLRGLFADGQGVEVPDANIRVIK